MNNHIDAPQHMVEGGKTLDEIPVDRYVGNGVCVKLDETTTLDDIKAANISEGDIVLFHTGMAEKYTDPVYFETYPVLSEDIASYLVEQNVGMVGFDTGSADIEEGFPIHKILLGGEVLIIENLTNLDQLEGKQFTVYALPLRLDVDGAPARVIAEV